VAIGDGGGTDSATDEAVPASDQHVHNGRIRADTENNTAAAQCQTG
jgi:hypothetical protein